MKMSSDSEYEENDVQEEATTSNGTSNDSEKLVSWNDLVCKYEKAF